jgi:hypothetical protein
MLMWGVFEDEIDLWEGYDGKASETEIIFVVGSREALELYKQCSNRILR